MERDHSKHVCITVKGHLDTRWISLFPGMIMTNRENGTTQIDGIVADESALHGMLREIRDAGMSLVRVEGDMTGKEPTDMNVLVFGATGRSGSAVVRRLLDRGYTVTAFVRTPGKITETDSRLNIVQGDVLDRDAVEKAIPGHDAVISCLGAGLNGTVRSEGTRNVIAAMERYGVRRLISQSSLGVGDSRRNLNAYWKYIMFGMLLRKAYADHGVQEQYVMESDLDWTIVRPGALVDGPAAGDFLQGFSPTERNLTLKISLADLARFIVRELEASEYIHRTPGLSYRRVG
jgi:putative NADH-flavin reductase